MEIAEQKRNEAAREEEIQEKLSAFQHMQVQIQQLQEQAAKVQQVEGVLNHLTNAGLIKQVGAGEFEPVNTFEEHQQLTAQKQAESQQDTNEAQME